HCSGSTKPTPTAHKVVAKGRSNQTNKIEEEIDGSAVGWGLSDDELQDIKHYSLCPVAIPI
ncbi:MAG: hypothetical protein HY023_12410, partial [Chloroflexi bacterium]|nr:hypothetical protein [Chloroflexota bacterium]